MAHPERLPRGTVVGGAVANAKGSAANAATPSKKAFTAGAWEEARELIWKHRKRLALGLCLMIFAFGHISGGHFNPAVTAGLTAGGRFSTTEVVPYWVAQLAGGLVAAIAIRVIFSSRVEDKLVNAPGAGISDGKALVMEAIFTFLFVLVIATVATDERAPWNGVFAPFAIGLFIFTAATVCGPISGGSFNPARSIAPAIIGTEFGDLWIYIVGPLVGGVLGGLVHAYFRADA